MIHLPKAQVLITGGSEGIGRALAQRYLAAGSRVLITGRDAEKLAQASRDLPGLLTVQSDISLPDDRESLAVYVRETLPGLNILINNAGMQRRVPLAADQAPWAERQAEIDALFAGPVHLNHLLIPVLLGQGSPSMIVNVTSGGAYIPQVFAPVYSASKAALHHYSLILRHGLANTACRVVELIPPAVQTTLAGPGATAHGAPLDAFADAVFAKLAEGRENAIGFGPTEGLQQELSGKPLAEWMAASAARTEVERYG